MRRLILIALIAAFACGGTRVAGQEARPVKDDPSKPTHGIIRRAPAKPAEAAKPTAEGPKPAEGPKSASNPAGEPTKLAPTASTEAVAAAIAAAVRSAEEKKKEVTRPHPVHAETPRVRMPQRRYVVRWPSPRLQVHWDTPDDRISLSWGVTDRLAGNEQDDHGLVP